MQCNAMQCNAMQCNAMQCSAVQCSAVQCSAVQCSAVQYSTIGNTRHKKRRQYTRQGSGMHCKAAAKQQKVPPKQSNGMQCILMILVKIMDLDMPTLTNIRWDNNWRWCYNWICSCICDVRSIKVTVERRF